MWDKITDDPRKKVFFYSSLVKICVIWWLILFGMTINIYINGYMNGPIVSVNIIRNIISISSMIIGASQYFLRFFMNSNSSFNVPSFSINAHLLMALILLRLTCRRLVLLRVCDHWRSSDHRNVHVLFHLFDLHVL